MIRNILILVLIITIIFNFKNICSNITKEHFYSSEANHCYNFDKNNTRNGGNGYQCTIGCKSKVDKYGRYPFKSMKEANDACKAEGFNRLCTKKEVIDAKVDICCSGWTHSLLDNSADKYHVGYSLAGASPVNQFIPGCGRAGETWIGWAGHDKASRDGSAAHCCGINKKVRNLLNEVKEERTELSTKLANKEMKMHSLLTDVNTTYSATKNINDYNVAKRQELEQLIQTQNDQCEQDIENIRTALAAGVDQYRKIKLGIQCGDGETCKTDENITSYATIIGDERTIFDNNINDILELNKSLSEDKKKSLPKDSLAKYREYKNQQFNRIKSKKNAILSKRQREVDNLTGENTAKIKKHCNYINMNIASIQSSTNSQNDLNVNATVWSSQAPDKVNSGGMPDSPNQASITPCTNRYELPSECSTYM